MTNTLVIREYFANLHDSECNQKYNKTLPYSFHLDMVYEQAKLFPEYWQFGDLAIVISLYGHDSIEDARLTYNDLINIKFPYPLAYSDFDVRKEAADIIYACTEEKGKNRLERHSDQYYKELMENSKAVFVKLCDVLANVKFSLLTNSSMFEKYKEEWNTSFKPKLIQYGYNVTYETMVNYMESIFTIKK